MSKTDIMTTKDKLALIVQRAIDGGWKDKDTEYGINKSEIFGFLIEFNDCVMSIPDLISNSEFMKAVYGGKCKDKYSEGNKTCGACDGTDITCLYRKDSHLYHALEAVKLLLTSTPDAAIEYLYEEMKK